MKKVIPAIAKTRYYLVSCLLMVGLIVYSINPQPGQAGDDPQVYQMGVFPFLSAREIEKIFAPMAAELGTALGKRVMFRTASSYENFMEQLHAQQYDIAFVQPFDYIDAADDHGYVPLATRDELLTAIIVTKNPQQLDIKNLKGKTIALPPKVAAVSILIKGYVKELGYTPDVDVKFRHFGTHVSCMQQVLIGSADGCGTAFASQRFFNKKMKVDLKVAIETSGIPHTLFIAHPRMPEADREKITSTILSWASTENGKKLLERGRMKPFKRISDQEYNGVRKIASSLK